MEKSFPLYGPYKEAGVAILIYDKVDFRLKSIRRDNEGHFILIKGIIHKEKISVHNIYAPNTWVHIYIKTKNSNSPKSTDKS
jgi:hypothetical protein